MGMKISTIVSAASEVGLTRAQYLELLLHGTEYQKDALGIVSPKAANHKKNLHASQLKQNALTKQLNAPTKTTQQKPNTQPIPKQPSLIETQIFNQVAQKIALSTIKSNSQSSTTLASCSSYINACQKPTANKKRKKQEALENLNHIDEISDVELFIFWEALSPHSNH